MQKVMLHNERQADDLVGEEGLERFERLECDLRKIKQRWDNRLAGKETSSFEAYINGDIELILYGEWNCGLNDVHWLIRIPPASTIFHAATVGEGEINVVNADNRNVGYEVGVFVGVTEFCGLMHQTHQARDGDCP